MSNLPRNRVLSLSCIYIFSGTPSFVLFTPSQFLVFFILLGWNVFALSRPKRLRLSGEDNGNNSKAAVIELGLAVDGFTSSKDWRRQRWEVQQQQQEETATKQLSQRGRSNSARRHQQFDSPERKNEEKEGGVGGASRKGGGGGGSLSPRRRGSAASLAASMFGVVSSSSSSSSRGSKSLSPRAVGKAGKGGGGGKGELEMDPWENDDDDDGEEKGEIAGDDVVAAGGVGGGLRWVGDNGGVGLNNEKEEGVAAAAAAAAAELLAVDAVVLDESLSLGAKLTRLSCLREITANNTSIPSYPGSAAIVEWNSLALRHVISLLLVGRKNGLKDPWGIGGSPAYSAYSPSPLTVLSSSSAP